MVIMRDTFQLLKRLVTGLHGIELVGVMIFVVNLNHSISYDVKLLVSLHLFASY